VIVTTDRISASDVVLSKPVADKGKVLNAISLFWFDFTKEIIPNHILSGDLRGCLICLLMSINGMITIKRLFTFI